MQPAEQSVHDEREPIDAGCILDKMTLRPPRQVHLSPISARSRPPAPDQSDSQQKAGAADPSLSALPAEPAWRQVGLLAILVLVVAVAFTAVEVRWTKELWHPGGYDEVTHIGNALGVWQQVERRGWAGAVDAWGGRYPTEEMSEYWPGAGYLATVPGFALLPGNVAAPYTVLPLLLLITLLAIGLGARDMLGDGEEGARRRAPLWAIWAALLTVGFLVMWRHFTPSVFIVALSAAAHMALARSDGFRRVVPSLAWGACVGLGLMCDRLTMLTFCWLAPVVALVGLRAIPRRLLGAALGVGAVFLIAGPFYERWWLIYSGTALGRVEGGVWTTIKAVAAIVPLFPARLFGPSATAAAVLAMGLLVFGRRRVQWRSAAIWLAALVSTGMLASATEESQVSMLVPVVVPIAVLTGGGLALVEGRWPRIALLVAAVAASGVAFLGWSAAECRDDPCVPVNMRPIDEIVDLLSEPGPLIVADMAVTPDGWGPKLLHYLLSIEHPEIEVEWAMRRQGTNAPEGTRFILDPCSARTILLFHLSGTDHWRESSHYPVNYGSVAADEVELYELALDTIPKCFEEERRIACPLAAQAVVLRRRPDTQPAAD